MTQQLVKIQTRIIFDKLLEFDTLALTLVQFYESMIFHEVIIYLYINDLTKYLTPDINKYIVYLLKVIPYLESTYVNYSKSKFSKHLHIFG